MAADLQPPSGPIAYLTGEYPKVSHTFIQREVAALRQLGQTIHTCTVRRAPAADVVGPEQQAEAARTFCILDAARKPTVPLLALASACLHAPRRFLSAIALAWQTRPPGARALLWQLFYFVEAAILARHLRRIGAVHLHNHFANSSGSVAMLTSALSGIPFSFTMHGPSEFFEAPKWRLDEKVARAAFTVAISHFCRSQLMYLSDRSHWDRIHIVHCGIDPMAFAPNPGRTPRQHIAFVGRLDPVKGADLLLDAVAALRGNHPDLRVSILGDGPHGPRIRARAATLGLSDIVTFLGARPSDDVARLLADADLLVLPSFAEGVPVVLMEAMATGIPVIASAIAGIPELVEQGASGLLVPPGDLAALTHAIASLLNDPTRSKDMGQQGRAKVIADFNIGAEVRKLSALFAAVTRRD